MRQRGNLGWFKHDITHRGITAWILAFLLMAFYFFLYFPDKFGELGSTFKLAPETTESLYALGAQLNIFEDFMRALGHRFGTVKDGWDPLWNKWTLYGTLYTLAIGIGGLATIRKYKHNRYQVIRISVIILVQAIFGYSLPLFLGVKEYYSYYFSYFWPLKIEYLYPENLIHMPLPLILYGVLGGIVIAPMLGVFFGKRWYCAWVCGCGGLANTFGDPWRHLSSKSNASWSFEKVSINVVMVIALMTTAFMGLNAFIGEADKVSAVTQESFSYWAGVTKFLYGTFVVALLSGAVGVAFYPLGGTRLWCRFFCPMAAILGLVQKFGRYRITVKKNMCISCGMCSKYCEMGIDVRAYAQRNQSFVRASCVGCGLCAEVCPRGVLRLEARVDQDPQELTMNAFLNQDYRIEPERKAS